MNNIDIDRLRKELIDYYGTASVLYPIAVMDLTKVETCSAEELINIAKNNEFNLNDYIIEEKEYTK